MPESALIDLIPQALADKNLPVGRQIHEIDFDARNIIALAETGSGKTIVIAAIEALRAKREGRDVCIYMRQPTRMATSWIYKGLKLFWESAGLKIGISTRDQKENLEDADIIVFSDGSLTGLLDKGGAREPIVYFDEIHSMGLEATEVEIGICKQRGIPMRLLTATIDPSDLMTYLGEGTKLYELSGRTFPITKHVELFEEDIIDRSNEDEFHALMDRIVGDLAFEDERALIFLPTKKMCEDEADRHSKDVPATYCHGEVYPPDLEAWVEEQVGSFIIFATVSAATSVTIDVDKVFVLDERITSETREGVEEQYKIPVDNNTLLQMIGRCGRLRPGDATLLSSKDRKRHSDVWGDIEPAPIQYPCARSTPYSVILTMASYGVKTDDEIDLLSDMDPREMRHARSWLIRTGCLAEDGSLTHLGGEVRKIPLPLPMAHLVATARSYPLKRALLAAAIMQGNGAYALANLKPRSYKLAAARTRALKQAEAKGEWDLARLDPRRILPVWPVECIVDNNMPLTMARVMQRAYEAQDRANKAETLPKWCIDHNVNYKIMRFSMRDFEEALKSLRTTKKAFREDDIPSLGIQAANHIRNHPVSTRIDFPGQWGNYVWTNEEGEPEPIGAVLCSMTRDLLRIDDGCTAWGIPKIIRFKGGRMASLEWPVITR